VFNASNNRGGLVDTLLDGADQDLAAPIAMVVVTVVVAAGVFGRRSHDRAQETQDRVGADGEPARTADRHFDVPTTRGRPVPVEADSSSPGGTR
jgi:hypothetical protein